MSTGIEKLNGDGMTDAEARAAARELWQTSSSSGDAVTGVDLGRTFGRSDRWGRKQIAEARSEAPGIDGEVPGNSAAGSRAGRVRAIRRAARRPFRAADAGTVRRRWHASLSRLRNATLSRTACQHRAGRVAGRGWMP